MFIYSGICRFCECGLETSLKSIKNETLRTGDIVVSYSCDKNGFFNYMGGLTVVVCNQWQSYSDGTHKLIKEYQNNIANDAFIMGIKDVKLGEEWQVELVKRFEDIIDGEKWENFGFNFKEN